MDRHRPVQSHHALTEQQLFVAESTVFSAEHQGNAGVGLEPLMNPGHGLFRCLQWDLSVVQASATGHNPMAIGQGINQ